jgi:threonine dehydratase
MLSSMNPHPDQAMPQLVTLATIEAAQRRIQPHIHETPVLTSRALGERAGCTLLCKAEHLQRGGSFKLRGALNRVLLLSDAERSRGVVAYSSGNHAQGVALAGQLAGVSATIVMPADAPRVKLDATREYGAEVITYDRQRESREGIAQAICAARGAVLIPPFDDEHVIAGQGPLGLEIARQCPDLDFALIPVGGGGLISGVAIALRALQPACRIIGVEPARANDAQQSLRSGQIVRIAPPTTIADGVATLALGQKTFPILRALVDDIWTVQEAEIRSALAFVWTRTKQLVEPTGALTTAAALAPRHQPLLRARRVLTLFCGGNVDPASLSSLLAEQPDDDRA